MVNRFLVHTPVDSPPPRNLDHALAQVLNHTYSIYPHDLGTFRVDCGQESYIVDFHEGTCTCPIGNRRKPGRSTNCGHIAAVETAIREGQTPSPYLTPRPQGPGSHG